MKKTVLFFFPVAIFFVAATSGYGQVKVGSNPTSIHANTNLEVESSDGTFTRINKSNGNVGIGTSDSPSHRLHVNATDPVRFEGLQMGDISQRLISADESGVLKLQPLNYIASGPSSFHSNLGNSWNTLTMDNIINGGSPSAFSGNAFIAPETGDYEIEVCVIGYVPNYAALGDGGTIFFGINVNASSSSTYIGTMYFGKIASGTWVGMRQAQTSKLVRSFSAGDEVRIRAGGYGGCNGNNAVRLSYFSAQKLN